MVIKNKSDVDSFLSILKCKNESFTFTTQGRRNAIKHHGVWKINTSGALEELFYLPVSRRCIFDYVWEHRKAINERLKDGL